MVCQLRGDPALGLRKSAVNRYTCILKIVFVGTAADTESER